MSKKSTSSTTELKHFIRTDTRASQREIVVERVKAGSASFEFLKKMEARRKKHECVRMIDMRGKVAYECKSYIHKNQVFWMDDISLGIFLKGLKENNDVFTNESFEEIINGDHTLHKSNQNKSAQTVHGVKQSSQAQEASASIDGLFNEEKFLIEGKDADIFYLGYFQRRGDSRLKHASDILIHYSGKTISAKTKDISSTGFKASFQKPVNLAVDDEILITFTGFNNSYKSKLFDVKYKVVGMEYNEPDFIIRAIHNDDNNEAKDFFENFIQEQKQNIKGRRKLDIEDTRLTAESILTELYYTNTTPTIPFFISTLNKKLSLQTICVNLINKPIIQCFKNVNDSFDFTNFSNHKRIKTLIEKVQDDGQKDPVMAVFTDENGLPKIIFDYEFESYEVWQVFLLDKFNKKNINLFKIIIRSVSTPDQRKLDQKIEKLKKKSESSVDEMLKFYTQITKAGALVDITSELSDILKNIKLDIELLNQAQAIATNHQDLSGNDVDILQFGYTEQRREDRYHVSVDTLIQLNDKKFKAVTKDISLKGLCVELKNTSLNGCKKGDEVNVDFPVLHQRAKERIQLINMPYTITCIHYENGKPILHFRREKTKHWNSQTGFFKDMIDRNIDLIKLDTKDIETATKSKLIGSIAVENTATLPLFILKNTEGGGRTASVALPPNPSDLTDFFEVEPGVYDFKPITFPNRLSRLTSNVKSNQPSELIIYMYKKQIPGIAKFDIYSAIESDFENESERTKFMSTCKEYDYCVVKISVSRVQKPIELEITAAVEQLQDTAPHGVQRLNNHFNNIIAIGDISDISSQMIVSL